MNKLFEAVDTAFEENRITTESLEANIVEDLVEDENDMYSYSNEEIREYYYKMKDYIMNADETDEDFDKFVDSEIKDIDHIEADASLRLFEPNGGEKYYGFAKGPVITYLKDGRKFICDGDDAISLSLVAACELVVSTEMTDEAGASLNIGASVDVPDDLASAAGMALLADDKDLRTKINAYICDDTHRMEDFTDIEITSEDVLDSAHKMIDQALAKMSDEDLAKMSTEIDNDSIDLTQYAHYCWDLESEEPKENLASDEDIDEDVIDTIKKIFGCDDEKARETFIAAREILSGSGNRSKEVEENK